MENWKRALTLPLTLLLSLSLLAPAAGAAGPHAAGGASAPPWGWAGCESRGESGAFPFGGLTEDFPRAGLFPLPFSTAPLLPNGILFLLAALLWLPLSAVSLLWTILQSLPALVS